MAGMIGKLYRGEITPADWTEIQDPEYKALRSRNLKAYGEFKKKLDEVSPPLVEEFVKLMDMHLEAFPYETEQAFTNGFCLGVKLMVEALTGETE